MPETHEARQRTPVDDLQVGDYIAVVASNEKQPGSWRGPQPTGGMSGIPCKILGISLPFLAVQGPYNCRTYTIDVRAWQVRRVTKKYAMLFFRQARKQQAQTEPEQRPAGPICHCCRCGSKLIERLEKSAWVKLCRECGYRPVETGK